MDTSEDKSSVAVYIGKFDQLQLKLNELRPVKAIVLVFENIQSSTMQILEGNLEEITRSFFEALTKPRSEQVGVRIGSILAPEVLCASTLLRQTGVILAAKKAVLESGDFINAAEITKVARWSENGQPHEWKKAGQIFAIEHKSVEYYPTYGLNFDAKQPLEDLAPIISVFRGHKDDWGMAYWFMSLNSFLGGRAPRDMLASNPEKVLDASRKEVEEILNG